MHTARRLGADILRVSAMGKKAIFRTDAWETDPYIRTHDFLAECIELCHKNGILFMPYIPGAVHLPYEYVIKRHPDWLQKAYPHQPDTEYEAVQHGGTDNAMICPLGGYREFYEEMLRAVLLEHDVDGWYSDAWKDCYFKDVCYCASCRERYLAEQGVDIWAEGFTEQSDRVQAYSDWYVSRVIELARDSMQMVFREKRLPTIINGIAGVLGYQPQGRWGEAVDALYDVLHFERKTDPYNRLLSASYLQTKGRKGWFYAGLYSPLQFEGPQKAEENFADERRFPYREELYNEYFIALACNQTVNLIRMNSLTIEQDSPGFEALDHITSIIRVMKPYFESYRYLPQAAVLTLQTERHEITDRLPVRLLQSGVQTTILKKEDLENASFLAQFPVIVCESAETEHLSRLSRSYVRQGGTLVCCSYGPEVDPEAREEKAGVYRSGEGKAVVCRSGALCSTVKEWGDFPVLVTTGDGEAVFVLTSGEKGMLLHLINITRHLTELFAEGLSEIPPARNINVFMRAEEKPTIYSIRTGERFEVAPCREGWRFTVPKLENYDAVLLEM